MMVKRRKGGGKLMKGEARMIPARKGMDVLK